MANPLAHLSSAAGEEAAQAADGDQGQAAGGTDSDAPGAVPEADVESGGLGLGPADVGLADAGPILAGDDDANGAPDVGSNLMALLSQLAPAGQ